MSQNLTLPGQPFYRLLAVFCAVVRMRAAHARQQIAIHRYRATAQVAEDTRPQFTQSRFEFFNLLALTGLQLPLCLLVGILVELVRPDVGAVNELLFLVGGEQVDEANPCLPG